MSSVPRAGAYNVDMSVPSILYTCPEGISTSPNNLVSVVDELPIVVWFSPVTKAQKPIAIELFPSGIPVAVA